MSIDMLGNEGIPWECLDRCATPDVCTLNGCRELRLTNLSAPNPGPRERASIPFMEISWLRDVTVLPEPNTYEADILVKYSTPGLKKNELTRSAKKDQLNAQGMGKFPEDRDKILDQLYPKGQVR